MNKSFHGGSVVKKPPANVGDTEDAGLYLLVHRIYTVNALVQSITNLIALVQSITNLTAINKVQHVEAEDGD